MAIFQRGTPFAKHVIGRLVGAGQFAEVYEATAEDGAVRALKVLKVDVPLGAKAQARLVQECDAVATIEHTHVVGYHGSGVDFGRAWLLIELVRGPNLRELVRAAGGSISVERAVSIMQQAAEGVAAAHKLGIVHRDLKPENILVGPDDLVKVADFGSANVGSWGVRTTASEQDLTSCLYVAPEYLMRRRAELSNDVYVMGLMLHELAGGVHPIVDEPMTPIQAIRRHLTAQAPSLATRSTPERPIPGDLVELTLRALARDPAQRCSMRELADGLAIVLTRLRAPRRAAARSLPLPDRSLALARTEQAMAASGPRGTMVMAASMGGAAEATIPEAARPAAPPPPPAGAVPITLRAPPFPLVPITLGHHRDPGRSSAPAAWPYLAERRSTGAPVERPAPPLRAGPRAPPLAVAVAGAAMALGLAGWLLLGSGVAMTARAPPAPAPAAPTASAMASLSAASPAPAPTAEVSAPRPRASAVPARARPPPPPQRPRLLFP